MAQSQKLHCVTLGDYPIKHSRVIGSPVHVRQILTNLMSNAVKYNRPGGSVTGSVEEVSLTEDTVVFRFTVSDTGLGMSEEFQQRLFEPFAREHPDDTHVNGTGLGMPIVKKLVDEMGGSISVQSKQGEGSTFVVTLPFKRDPSACGTAEPSAPAAADLHGLRILLAEDSALNQEIAGFLLREAGAEVETADNGAEAVEHFSASQPGHFDVILMDLMMPVMDGYEATRHIRTLDRPDASIPIIAMTANAFTEDIRRCKEAGMNAHVAKPFEMAKLFSVISSCVRKA